MGAGTWIFVGAVAVFAAAPFLNPLIFRYAVDERAIDVHLFGRVRLISIGLLKIDAIDVRRHPRTGVHLQSRVRVPLGLNFYSPAVQIVMLDGLVGVYTLTPPDPDAFAAEIRTRRLALKAAGALAS